MVPFLKIPVVLAGDQTKNEADKQVEARILPQEISCYQPGYYWGSFIYMKGGHVFCTTLTAEDLETKLKEYWNTILNGNKIKTF